MRSCVGGAAFACVRDGTERVLVWVECVCEDVEGGGGRLGIFSVFYLFLLINVFSFHENVRTPKRRARTLNPSGRLNFSVRVCVFLCVYKRTDTIIPCACIYFFYEDLKNRHNNFNFYVSVYFFHVFTPMHRKII